VSQLLSRLCPGDEQINFFKYVIDPFDFGQSVENVFYVSFLINEGKVGISVREDGEVMICKWWLPPVDPNTNLWLHADRSDPGVPPDKDLGEDPERFQSVIELDMTTWRDAIETFQITTPLIPHRTYVEENLQGNAWYQ
jgi:hypothetical protein